MEFLILGALEVRDGERVVAVPGGKQRALLALLVLHRGETISTDRLVDELWGEAAPPTAAKIVQNYVSQLRKSLGADVLHTRGRGYVLDAEATSTDLDRFERLVAEARDADAEAAGRLLRTALALWRGPVLADVVLDGDARTEIGRLEQRRLRAVEQRVDADLALGRHADLVGELEALAARHPLEERLSAQLMLALYRSGRQAEALAAFRRARATLAEDLGLEPGPALRELEAKILRHDPALAAPVRPPFRRAETTRRPWRLVAAGVVLVAVAAVVAGFRLVTADDGGLPGVAADAVGMIDPATNRLVAQLAVGRTPTSIAAGSGAVWVLNADNQTVSEVDPETKAVRTFGTGGTPTDLAAGDGALWVANGARLRGVQFVGPVATTVSRVDPRTHAVRATVRLPRGRGEVSNVTEDHLAVGRGAVWAINPDFSVSRIAARTAAVRETVRGVDALAVATGEGGTWVLNTDRTVSRVDKRPLRTIRVAATTLTDIAVGGGSVWLTDPYEGTLWRVDPAPRVVMRTIDVGAGAGRVAFGEGGVWVVNPLRGTVTRVDPSTNRVAATIAIGNTPRDVATGEGSVWVSVGPGATAAAAADSGSTGTLPASFCGELFARGEPDLLIASDLPLQGGARLATIQMSEAIAFVVRRHGFRAGRHRIGYQSCDDSTAQAGNFTPEKCLANAKAYAAHERLVGVVGPFNSGCAFEQIPVAAAAGLALVSPSATAVDLTRRGPLTPRGALERLHPTAVRTFARVVPGDDHHAAASVLLARRLGAKRLFVLHDGEEGWGLPRALAFRRFARKLGLAPVGFRRWDPRGRKYDGLAREVARARPDAVFLGGGLYSNGGAVVAALRRRLGDVAIFAPEFLPISDLFESAGASARGTYVSLTGLTLDRLPPRGRRFVREFAATQPGGRVDVSAVYAAQAAEVLLAAIARSDGARASVSRELLRTQVRDGLVGSFRIGPTGDPSRAPITILRAERGGGTDVLQGYEGAVVDSVIVPPASFGR